MEEIPTPQPLVQDNNEDIVIRDNEPMPSPFSPEYLYEEDSDNGDEVPIPTVIQELASSITTSNYKLEIDY